MPKPSLRIEKPQILISIFISILSCIFKQLLLRKKSILLNNALQKYRLIDLWTTSGRHLHINTPTHYSSIPKLTRQANLSSTLFKIKKMKKRFILNEKKPLRVIDPPDSCKFQPSVILN